MTTARVIGLVLAAWLVVAALLGYAGAFALLPGPFGVGIVVVAGLVAPMAAYVASPAVRSAVAGIGLMWLTLFHAWRVPAGLVFFWYGDAGLLPEVFVARAGTGDVIAGLLAIAAVLVAARLAYLAFHLVGLIDLVIAVGTGLVFTAQAVPGMATIATFPVVLIPVVGVGLSAATHVFAFHLLLRGRQAARTAAFA